MIGFYNYTVILTYMGLISSLFGIMFAAQGRVVESLIFLGASLLCDTFDGKVARAKKDRTDGEKMFGVQIDSLCDLISFGVFPIVICYMSGMNECYDWAIIAYYCLCCVIRLAYFNVLALDETNSGYHGLPVVCYAVFLPILFLLNTWIHGTAFVWLIRSTMFLFGTLYIADFKMAKPKLWVVGVLTVLFVVPFVLSIIL